MINLLRRLHFFRILIFAIALPMYYFVSQGFISEHSVLSVFRSEQTTDWTTFFMHMLYFAVIYSLGILTVRAFIHKPKPDLSPGVSIDGKDETPPTVLDIVSPRILIKTETENPKQKPGKKSKIDKFKDAID